MSQDFESKSFLEELFEVRNTEDIKWLARLYIGIYSFILIVFFVVSHYLYWKFLSEIFSLLTGASLFGLLFIVAFAYSFDLHKKVAKRFQCYAEKKIYKISVVFGVILVGIAIFIQYTLDVMTDHYEFQCGTYLVDINNGIYHILWCDCESLQEAGSIVEMRGYEIEQTTNCELCEECKWIVEDAIDAYESDMYYRR
jgi:hypothetical protein